MPTGELSSRLNSDTAEMSNDLTWVLRFTIEASVRLSGIVAYMLVRSSKLAAVALSLTPLVALVSRVYGKWMGKNAEAVQAALAEASGTAQEVLGARRTVFSFATECLEQDRFSGAVQRHYRLSVRQTAIQGFYYMAISTFLMNCVMQVPPARELCQNQIGRTTLLSAKRADE